MIRTRGGTYLQGCILSIFLIIPIMAEVGRISGSAKRSFGEQTPTRKTRWRRASFDCGKCDGGTINAAVTVYADRDGNGKMQGFKLGKYRADRGHLNKVGNDTISSLAVEEGYTVRLCQHEGDGNGAGKCQDFAAGQQNVPDELDDQTSFILVRRSR